MVLILRIIFTTKDTKQSYLPEGTLSAEDNKNLSALLSNGSESSVYWNKYERESENKNTSTNVYRYFLESNFASINRFFVRVYLNRDNDLEIFKS